MNHRYNSNLIISIQTIFLVISEYRRQTETNVRSSKSYHHCVDSRYPLVYNTLAEIYEHQAKLNTGHGVTWYRPQAFMSYTQIYHKVRNGLTKRRDSET